MLAAIRGGTHFERLRFLDALREVLLLKSQAVFEDRPLVPQFRELLLSLPSECFLAFL